MEVFGLGSIVHHIELGGYVPEAMSSICPANLALSVRVASRLSAVPSLFDNLAEFAAAPAAISSVQSQF